MGKDPKLNQPQQGGQKPQQGGFQKPQQGGFQKQQQGGLNKPINPGQGGRPDQTKQGNMNPQQPKKNEWNTDK